MKCTLEAGHAMVHVTLTNADVPVCTPAHIEAARRFDGETRVRFRELPGRWRGGRIREEHATVLERESVIHVEPSEYWF